VLDLAGKRPPRGNGRSPVSSPGGLSVADNRPTAFDAWRGSVPLTRMTLPRTFGAYAGNNRLFRIRFYRSYESLTLAECGGGTTN
jgi:hypothetical protein